MKVPLLLIAVLWIASSHQTTLDAVLEGDDIFAKYQRLSKLHAEDVDSFFKLMIENVDALTPVYYTPGVGAACQGYGRIPKAERPKSLTITLNDIGKVKSVLKSWGSEVRIIVVTDGERILGLGDLGVWGMGIPVGKLALYTAMAGIPPSMTLPIVLDAGTNNKELLSSEHYDGLKQRRDSGRKFLDLVDEFVKSVAVVYPDALLQFEDFGGDHAFALLQEYKDFLPSFNDDIQGTAAVTVAGLIAAVRLVDSEAKTSNSLSARNLGGPGFSTRRYLFLGAGQAAIGIAEMLTQLMLADEGVDLKTGRKQIVMMDSKGVLHALRVGSTLSQQKRPWVSDLSTHPELREYVRTAGGKHDLAEVVKAFKPHALIGVSGQGGAFTPRVLQAMAAATPRPIIFSLSNPTSKSECTAAEAYEHTNEQAIFASGSPFPAFTGKNGKVFVPGQANNCYIFPGVGLGVLVSRATSVSDSMMLAAARGLADLVTPEDLATGSLFPPLAKARWLSARVAAAVAAVAVNESVALVLNPPGGDWITASEKFMYDPTRLPPKEDL